MRTERLTAKEAAGIPEIAQKLLHAPRTVRHRYGPRQEQTEEQRLAISKERNRTHARATRQRKKIFAEVSYDSSRLYDTGYAKSLGPVEIAS